MTKPYREAKKDGAVGFMKGFAKGSVELFSKPGAGKAPTFPIFLQFQHFKHGTNLFAKAMFGLMAYPAMGIHATLKRRGLNSTESQILDAQIAFGVYKLQLTPATSSEIDTVISNFNLRK